MTSQTMSPAEELEVLALQAQGHKTRVRFHRVQLHLTMERISEIKRRLEAVGIQNGVAEGEKHGQGTGP